MKAVLTTAALALAMTACQMTVPFNTAPTREGYTRLDRLTGTIAYRERIALPPDATVEVRIVDVSLMDAPAETIALARFPSEGRQVPLPFAIDYDPARIIQGRRYALQARISDAGGKLLWITDTAFHLSFAGEPLEIPLVQATR